jgi:plasmid stabilization system protein ParE
MRTLRFTSEAIDDLVDIGAYIAETSGSKAIAERFVQTLIDQCEKLAALSGTLGRQRPELRMDLRSFVFKNYMIYFHYRDDVFEVVAILEGHRDASAHLKKEAP